MMTFPTFWFFGFLNHMGWPRTKGLLTRKKVVSYMVLWGAVTQLVKSGIALGALRPKTAVRLIADLFGKRDWSRQPATELWSHFDSSEQVANNSDKPPEEVIAGIKSPMNIFNNKPEKLDKILKDVIEWEFILTDEFSAYYHLIFARGLIWGLSHPEEAINLHEEQRQRLLKNLPEMLKAGLKVHSPETFEEFADANQESVDEFQDEIRPLAEVPQELLDLPIINARIRNDVEVEIQ